VFFYAGARALLVSHWEVDSAATVKLITTAIGALAKDKSLGRAEALRRAMLSVMGGHLASCTLGASLPSVCLGTVRRGRRRRGWTMIENTAVLLEPSCQFTLSHRINNAAPCLLLAPGRRFRECNKFVSCPRAQQTWL